MIFAVIRPQPYARSWRSTLIAPLFGVALPGCSSQEQETHYVSLAAAQMAGAIHQGWIPDWLPKKAHNLKEKHNLEGSRSILRFTFPESAEWVPPDSCSRIRSSEIRGPALTASWWPQDVPSSSSATPRHTYILAERRTRSWRSIFRAGKLCIGAPE